MATATWLARTRQIAAFHARHRRLPTDVTECEQTPGAGGQVVERLDRAGLAGFDLFFLFSGAVSLGALLFLPLLVRAKPRPDDRP